MTLDEQIRAIVREELARARPTTTLVTVTEYARRWSISPSTVRAAIRERRLAVSRVGRAIRIASDERISGKVNDRTERARMTLLRGGKTP